MTAMQKNAIVTGARGGIGRAVVNRLVADGVRVLAVDLDVAGLAGPGIESLAVDLASDDAPERIVRATRVLGPIDILVNNAGVGGSKSLVLSDDALLDRIIGVNLRAVLRLTREVIPQLRTPGGCIVNVASVYGEVGFPGCTAYAVAKAGISQLTRQLAADLGPKGIRTNGVAPGVIRTPMTAHRLESDPQYWRDMVQATPLGTIGTPEQVASVIAFLCSDDAAYVLGQIIAVDGGWLACRSHAGA